MKGKGTNMNLSLSDNEGSYDFNSGVNNGRFFGHFLSSEKGLVLNPFGGM